jgi:hypothetical protein
MREVQEKVLDSGLWEERVLIEEMEGAKQRLLGACEERKCGIAEVAGETDAGRKVYAQVMRLGARKAERCMVLCSGASGESGIVVAHLYGELLTRLGALPEDFSLLVINAVNPEGRPWPPHFLPQKETAKRWQNPLLQDTDERMARDKVVRDHVMKIEEGNKQHDLFRGRVRPAYGAAWEERVLKEIYHQFLVQAHLVVSVDIRPSFQPFGKMDLWSCCEPGGSGHTKLKTWFRRLQRESLYDFYTSYGKHASVGPGIFVEEDRHMGLRVECGTYTPSDVLGGGTLGGGVWGGMMDAGRGSRGMSSEGMSRVKESKKGVLPMLFSRDHPHWKMLQRDIQGVFDVLMKGMSPYEKEEGALVEVQE